MFLFLFRFGTGHLDSCPMKTPSRNMKAILAMTRVVKLLNMTPRLVLKTVKILRKVTLQKNAQRMEDSLNAAYGSKKR